MWKWIIGLIVIIAIAAGAVAWKNGWIDVSQFAFMQQPTTDSATTTPQVQNTQPAVVNDLPTATGDTSNDALLKDEAAVDVQMTALGTDSSNSGSSLNDQPGAQEF